jgi:hypothetical protein
MNHDDILLFNRAVEIAQKGDKPTAHFMLQQLEKRYPNDPNLLLWLAYTAENGEISRTYLNRIEQLDPFNPSLANARAWLAQQATAPHPPNPVFYPPTYYPFPEFGRPKPKSSLPLVILVVMLVLFGSGLAGVFFLLNNNQPANEQDRLKAKGLPVYPKATLIALTPEEKEKLNLEEELLSTVKLKDFVLELYTIKEPETQEALKFYEDALKKQGWIALLKEFDIGYAKAKGFAKGNKIFLALSLNSNFSKELAKQIPGKVKSGEVLLICATGVFGDY